MVSVAAPPDVQQADISVDWEAVRARYPSVEACLYLNTASRGLISHASAAAGQNYYQAMLERADVALSTQWASALESARGRVAGFIGAPASSIAYVANASHGLNLAIDLVAERGEVLVHADEFPSVSLPWLQRGYDVRFLKPDQGGELTLDQIADAITPRTRYIAASAVQYASGFAVDLVALGQLCRDRGLYLFCDATQAVGAMPLDVADFQPDVLVFSGYKWVCAGYGLGVLYLSPSLLATKRLPGAGWRSASNAYGLSNNQISLVKEAMGLEYGNPIMPAPLILDASLGELAELGLPAIRSRSLQLMERLRDGLLAQGKVLRSPSDLARAGSIVMFETPDAPAMEQALADQGIRVSARQGLIRVSPHLYNQPEEIDAFLEAVRGS